MLVIILPVLSENQGGGRCEDDEVVLGEGDEDVEAVDDNSDTGSSVDVELQIRLIKTQVLGEVLIWFGVSEHAQ